MTITPNTNLLPVRTTTAVAIPAETLRFVPDTAVPDTAVLGADQPCSDTSAEAIEEGPLSVADLVVAAQDGDRAALGELFERYRPTIVALALRRVHNVHEAEELAQDVFVQAMLKIHQLRVPEAFGGWLRQIVHRKAINRLCRNKLAVACDPETLEATCVDQVSPETVAQDREQAAAVRSGIGRLGELDQQTLRAFYLQGQTLVEMSDRFDAPLGTIKRRLHTARRRLAETLRDDSPAPKSGSHRDRVAVAV